METQQNISMKRPALPPDTAEQPDGNRMHPFNAKKLCVSNTSKTRSTKLLTSIVSENATTVLDVLNADCWRLVLDQLPIQDVVRSERVSRAWQQVVLEYLTGVQNYWIMDSTSGRYTNSLYKTTSSYNNCRVIKIPQRNAEVFQNMMAKMGPFFVSITSRYINRKMLEAIAENCPNLKVMKIRFLCDSSGERKNIGLFTKCKQLKRVTLNLTLGSEILLNEIVSSKTLEGLTICGASSQGIDGRFLNHLRTYNLTTLGFIQCKNLQIKNIVSAVNHMTGLTRLVLCKNPLGPLRDVHLILNELPTLEHLSLNFYDEIKWVNEVAEAVGRLSRLRELNLWGSKSVTDEWLVAAARCPELSVVNFGRTSVTGHGVLALCRAQPALVGLVVAELTVTEQDLEACARCCPALRHLDAWGCPALTPRLPARLAWPRASPLRLRLHKGPLYLKVKDHQKMKKDRVQHEGITLIWDLIDYYAQLKPI